MVHVRAVQQLYRMLVCFVLSWLGAEALAGERWQKVKFSSPDELQVYFHKNHYSLESWREGERGVPRFYLTHVPEWWRGHYADEATTQEKKQYFFFSMMPMVLHANETIRQQRKTLLNLRDSMGWDDEEKAVLEAVATEYEVPAPQSPQDAEAFNQLLSRVDIVPVSLALAQGAIESGWGTSRFAAEGNALYGQWSWGSDAMTPNRVRTELGNYGVRAFKTPFESITAYMHNLNTNHAYQSFRQIRARLRQDNRPLTGTELAAGLEHYSERGDAYVSDIRSVIRVNKLRQTDDAFLKKTTVVMLEPVNEPREMID